MTTKERLALLSLRLEQEGRYVDAGICAALSQPQRPNYWTIIPMVLLSLWAASANLLQLFGFNVWTKWAWLYGVTHFQTQQAGHVFWFLLPLLIMTLALVSVRPCTR